MSSRQRPIKRHSVELSHSRLRLIHQETRAASRSATNLPHKPISANRADNTSGKTVMKRLDVLSKRNFFLPRVRQAYCIFKPCAPTLLLLLLLLFGLWRDGRWHNYVQTSQRRTVSNNNYCLVIQRASFIVHHIPIKTHAILMHNK